MTKQCCKIDYSEFTTGSSQDKELDVSKYREALFRAVNRADDTNGDEYAGWIPVIFQGSDGNNKPCLPLARPKNTGTVTFDPLNCQNSQFITDPERVGDPASTEIDCRYCEDWGNDLAIEKGVARLESSAGKNVRTGTYGCCNGNCNVFTNIEDIEHSIPYILPQYVEQWADDKYQLQWPDVYYGESLINGADYIDDKPQNMPTNGDRTTAWEIIPRIGEVPYDSSTSQYVNQNDHELAITKANQSNRTAGNFILVSVPKGWYSDRLKPLLGEFGYYPEVSDTNQYYIDLDLPTPEEFTVPFGFNDGTQNNVFIGKKKRLSWWKWDMKYCPAAWALENKLPLTSKNGEWSTQVYIPPGEVFWSDISPNEPRNSEELRQVANGVQQCPSGVKFLDEGELYILPHGCTALYVSCNMYERFYEAYNSIKNIPEVDSFYRFYTAMYAASHPLIDKITVDLHKPYDINLKVDTYTSTRPNGFSVTSPITTERQRQTAYAQPYYSFMNWYDKKYMSATNINLIENDQQFWNTLVSKYGSWFKGDTKFFSENLELNNSQLPSSSHLGLNLLYDFTVRNKSRTQGRSQPPSSIDSYNTLRNAALRSSFSFSNLKLSINNAFIERKQILRLNQAEDEECQELSQPALFTKYEAFDGIYQSNFLQSGYMDYKTYYVRNGNDDGDAQGFCGECDEYSSYKNYVRERCNADTDCFCDFSDAEGKSETDPCYGQGGSIQDWTIRSERYYGLYYDYNATPISVAFHQDGGIFYRGGQDEGRVRFGDRSLVQAKEIKVDLSFSNRSPFKFRIYDLNVQVLQSREESTFRCLRFPIVDQLSTPSIQTDNTWVIQSRPPQNNRWETQKAYLPGLSTSYAPRLTKYGGFNDDELKDMFPYGYEYLEDIGGQIVDTTFKYSSDNPFGCQSSASVSVKNYVEYKGTVNINSARGLYDHMVQVVEEKGFTKNRIKLVDCGDCPDGYEEVPNEEMQRFSTYLEMDSSDTLLNKNGQLLDAENALVRWPGGGSWRLEDIPEKSTGKTYALNFRLANPYLSKLLDTAGAEGNRNYYPPATNPQAWYDDIDYLGIPFSYCDRQRQWYDFGDQTSTVRITVKAVPKPTIAKFALFPPSPVQLNQRVTFNDIGQLKTVSQKGIISTSFKNQLQTTSNRSQHIPKLTFNNIVDFPADPPIVQPYDFSESFIINEKESKSLAPLMRTINGFSDNRKFKIVLKTKAGKFFQLDGLPTRYESHNKMYEGFPHFVQVVRDGSDLNTFLPGSVPLVQKKPLEDVTWITKPNTRFTADRQTTGEKFDPKWPLNLKLTHGYKIDPVKNKLTFSGSRMFFTLFPKPYDRFLLDFAADGDFIPVGSIASFGDRSGLWFKYSDTGTKFYERWVIFNYDTDYTWNRYSDLHFNFLNSSYIGYVYNSRVTVPETLFTFYREPYGDRSKKARAICSEMALKSYLVDSRGKRVNPGSLADPCVDNCTEKGLTFLRLETELYFNSALSIDWREIDDALTEILSYHIYKPECLNNESDYFLSNTYYSSKWSDLLGFDGIIFDHSEETQFISKYYPKTKYDNVFYKMITDNNNQAEIPVSRGEERHHSILPYGNTACGPFRFNIHQKYNVDYGNDLVNSAEISGVHNYLPFMDINDTNHGDGYIAIDKFHVPEKIENFADFDPLLIQPKIDETVVRDTGDEYIRSRPDLQLILTIPADAKLTQTLAFDSPGEYVISDTLRADTPLFYLADIDSDTTINCPRSQRDDLHPAPYEGNNYGRSFASIIGQARPLKLKNQGIPLENWTPDNPFAIWTRYCDLDEETCETEKCDNVGRGQTVLDATYKLANPTKLTYSEIAGGDMLAFISYNAGIVNGLNGVRPPLILRSVHSLVDNINSKQDILYSKSYPDGCNDKVVLPPEYQYPDWDSEVTDTFMAGIKDLQSLSRNYSPARQLLQADKLAEEMTFRALYGEKQQVNRTSLNGSSLLTPDQIINYVSPEITVEEMHNQILWSYDRSSSPGSDSRVKTEHSFNVMSRMRVGDRAAVEWAGVKVEASISANSTDVWAGNIMTVKVSSQREGSETFTVPISLTSATYSSLTSIESTYGEPEVADDQTIVLVEEGRKVVPDEVAEEIVCYQALCQQEVPEGTVTEGTSIYGAYKYSVEYSDFSVVAMENPNYYVSNRLRLGRYAWNDTYAVCDGSVDFWGELETTCKDYEYGYCSVDTAQCPPCTGDNPPEEIQLEAVSNRSYTTTKNIPVNNYINTDTEIFEYDYKYCRNNITNKGYFSRENFYYHPEEEFRWDLASEYNSEDYLCFLTQIPCTQGCGGECLCSYPIPQGSPPGTSCYQPCNYVQYIDNIDGPCEVNCKYVEPLVPVGNNCFCDGAVGCRVGQPSTCFAYGFAACPILWSVPMGPVGAQSCADAFLCSVGYNYWEIAGEDPSEFNKGPCGIRCFPIGYCHTPYFCYVQDCERCPQSNQQAPECDFFDTSGDDPDDSIQPSFSWGRLVAGPYYQSALLDGLPVKDNYNCGSTFDDPNAPSMEHKYTARYSTEYAPYDTYLIETPYGNGLERKICGSGIADDCLHQMLSIRVDNDQLEVSFLSGTLAWQDSNFNCYGPTIQLGTANVCRSTNYRVNESNSDLEVYISDNLGHISNYQKTDTVGCTNNVEIELPPQSQDWTIQELEGSCSVGTWIGQHINESVQIAYGRSSRAICQSTQIPGTPCLGRLEIANADTAFMSAAGPGTCTDLEPFYGICEGTLREPDCNDAESCPLGQNAWFNQLEIRHAEYALRSNEGNNSIPVDNIIEGMVPGTVSELKMKTYSVPGGQVVRPAGGPYGTVTEEMYVFVTVAYYTYRYRTPFSIKDSIVNARNKTNSEEGEDNQSGGCHGGRPFNFNPDLEELPLNPYWEDVCGDNDYCYQSEYYGQRARGSWLLSQQKLGYRCEPVGSRYPNWYFRGVAPHGCFPQYSQYWGRYDTPPNNFLSTVPTIQKFACNGSNSCYYNDKQWPAAESDFYGLAGQGTFLQCHRFLGKLWDYDYYKEF